MRKNDQNLRKDHENIRKHVGFYDFTHQLLEVQGKDSTKFLDYVFVNSIGKTKLKGAKYTTMLNEEAIIIDDVIVFRLEDSLYWVSTLFIDKMIEWFDKHKKDFDVDYKNITPSVAMWAVQGPDSKDVLNKMLGKNLDPMKFFSFEENTLADIDIWISRSGFTGELGYELYFDPKYGDLVRKELMEKGQDYQIAEIKTDVILTSIPAEKGYVIMSDLEGLNPYEAGFDWSIHWDKDFIGKEALEKIKADDPRQRLLGYVADENVDFDIEAGATVEFEGKKIGHVTKATYGYTEEMNIGYLVLDKDFADVGRKIDIISQGRKASALVTERVFYDKDDNRRFGR